MSHIQPSAIISEPVANIRALIEISWNLPYRVTRAILNKLYASSGKPKTSVRIAAVTAIFASYQAWNIKLLLARPRLVERNTGLLYPADIDAKARNKDAKHGFHGYLYISHKSKKFGTQSLESADAVWLHAHGGGFCAGEARQYHHTYMRWVDKAYTEYGLDLRIIAVEYPKSPGAPYPGCLDAMHSAYKYVLKAGIDPFRIMLGGDSAGGNGAISTCYRIIEEQQEPRLPTPGGAILLSPWFDLSRSTSGNSPNQVTDWLTTYDTDACRKNVIEGYMGTTIESASDPQVSPLWRTPSPDLPRQFLSAGTAEVLFADSKAWAKKMKDTLGDDSIECHFAEGQVHTFAVGGWLADPEVLEVSDQLILTFIHRLATQTAW